MPQDPSASDEPKTEPTTLTPLKDLVAVDTKQHSQLWRSWHFLQVYAHWGVRLPTTTADFTALMGLSPEGYAFFEPMREGCQSMHDSCSVFLKVTFQDVVKLGHDLLNFSKDASPKDGALFKAVADLIDAGKTDDAITLLADLQATAKNCQSRAGASATALAAFSTELSTAMGKFNTAQTALDRDDKTNEAALAKLAGKEETEGSLANYRKKIKDLRAEFDQLVTIAATTPTYVWVWPFGTIPAIVVAGIYSDRAIKKMKEIEAQEDALQKANDQLFAAQQAHQIYAVATSGLRNVTVFTQQALAHCSIVQDAWGSIMGDIDELRNWIDRTTDVDADGATRAKSKTLLELYLKRVGEAWAEMQPALLDLTTDVYVTMEAGSKTMGQFADEAAAKAA